MSGSVGGGGEKAEPNLTPILDMVFQLITFFMLVINFKSASMDLDLKLPVLGSAQPVETKGRDLLILNITEDGTLKILGQEFRDKAIESQLHTQAVASREVAKKENRDMKDDDDLPSLVVIRADKSTPFVLLNRVIRGCQENGYRNFALKAKNKPEE
jgi:biopolymer transport protein ExbD